MNRICLFIPLLALLSACSTQPSDEVADERAPVSDAQLVTATEPETVIDPAMGGSSLQQIAGVMAANLFSNDRGAGTGEPITVAAFVNLTSLEESNWLGIQLSEIFIHQLHEKGFYVVDYKATGNIKVTPKGDFVFSRDWDQLVQFQPITRVLTGTMSRNEMGVVVNARIINMATRQVDATAQGVIPNKLLYGGLDSLGSVYRKDGYIMRTSTPDNINGHMVELTH